MVISYTWAPLAVTYIGGLIPCSPALALISARAEGSHFCALYRSSVCVCLHPFRFRLHHGQEEEGAAEYEGDDDADRDRMPHRQHCAGVSIPEVLGERAEGEAEKSWRD